MPKKTTDSFEKNLQSLESLIKQLEKGELSLDESLKQFELGVTLAQKCHKTLKNAEQKIEVLTEKTLDATIEPFEEEIADNS